MLKRSSAVLILVALLSLMACRKAEEVKMPCNFHVRFEVDGDSLRLDSLLYVADAGYAYLVDDVRFYISDINLIREDNTREQLGGWWLVDAHDQDSQQLLAGYATPDNYIGVEFLLGLSDSRDAQNGLPSTTENDNMRGVPDSIGTFHYLKFGGDFLMNDSLYPFRLYTAGTSCGISYVLLDDFTVADGGVRLNLTMNLGEWLRNPADYDFVADGPYSMDRNASRFKLAANGLDVFSLNR